MNNNTNDSISVPGGFKFAPFISMLEGSSSPSMSHRYANPLYFTKVVYNETGIIYRKNELYDYSINVLEWAKKFDRYYEDGKYTVLDSGSNVVDVYGDVFIQAAEYLPIRYNNVHGSFIANGLCNLKGLPKYVRDDCIIAGGECLTSFNYLPEIVGGKIGVIYPRILLPKTVASHVYTISHPNHKLEQYYFNFWESIFTLVEDRVEELAYLKHISANDSRVDAQRLNLLSNIFDDEDMAKSIVIATKEMGLDIGLSKDFNNISTEALKANHRM